MEDTVLRSTFRAISVAMAICCIFMGIREAVQQWQLFQSIDVNVPVWLVTGGVWLLVAIGVALKPLRQL